MVTFSKILLSSFDFILKCPQYVKARMTSTLHTQVMWGQRVGQTLHKVLAGWLGVSPQDSVKSLRVQHYIVVFFPSVSSNNHLKMHLRCPWTGSYCRCRRNCPTACHKTPPWGVTGHKQSQPSSYTLTLTTTPPQTPPETRRERQPQLPQIVQECFHLVHMMWARQINLLPVCHVVWRCIGSCWRRSIQKQNDRQNGGMFAGKGDTK